MQAQRPALEHSEVCAQQAGRRQLLSGPPGGRTLVPQQVVAHRHAEAAARRPRRTGERCLGGQVRGSLFAKDRTGIITVIDCSFKK